MSAFGQTQNLQRQQQQQALIQSLLGQQGGNGSQQQQNGSQQQQGGSRGRSGRRGRQDGLPAGSRAPPANAGQSRLSRTGGAVAFGQGNDAALMQLAAQRATQSSGGAMQERIQGARGRQIGGLAVGTPISPIGDQAIGMFIENNPQCQGITREQVVRFLNAVRESGYNREDLEAFMRTLYVDGLLVGRVPDLQQRSRWGGGVFAEEILGVRGARGEQPLHSTLWEIVLANCADLDAITAALEANMDGQLGTQALDEPLPPVEQLVDAQSLTEINRGLAAFVASHPQCAPNEGDLREMLALVDAANLNARDLYALIRNFGLEGYFPSLMSRNYNYRSANMSFTPATTGVTEETFAQIKPSLLWAVLDRYCGQIAPFNEFLFNVITGRAAQNIPMGMAEDVGVVGQLSAASAYKPNGNGGDIFGNNGGSAFGASSAFAPQSAFNGNGGGFGNGRPASR
jgi:hypothetical protein